MSNEAPNSSKPKSKIAFAVIRMPDGTEHENPLPAKTFSSGREEGYYAQIPAFVYDDEVSADRIRYGRSERRATRRSKGPKREIIYGGASRDEKYLFLFHSALPPLFPKQPCTVHPVL